MPTSVGSQKKQENSRKTSTSVSLTTRKPFTVWITTNCGKFFKRWEYRSLYLPPQKPVCRSRNNSLNWAWNNRLVQNWERSTTRLYIVTLFNFYAQYIMRNARLDESQVGIKIARRNINKLRYAVDTTLMSESEEELKSLSMKVREESEKSGLKLNIQKTKIMACSPITAWQIDGRKVETVKDFLFLGSKITVDGDCSHEIKRHRSLEEKL